MPHFKHSIATTQARLLDKVYNFCRFSDRNKCIFIAREFGAKKIELDFFVLKIQM